MGNLKRVRGLFESAAAEGNSVGIGAEAQQSRERTRLPWPPRAVAVSRLADALRELTDAAQVSALAAADNRRTAAEHYARRIAELLQAPTAGAPPETATSTENAELDQDGAPEPGQEEIGAADAEHLRITAYVTLDQVERLEDDRRRIRRAFRVVLDRTTLIRALLEGYRLSGLDPVKAGVRSEQEFVALVTARLEGGEE